MSLMFELISWWFLIAFNVEAVMERKQKKRDSSWINRRDANWMKRKIFSFKSLNRNKKLRGLLRSQVAENKRRAHANSWCIPSTWSHRQIVNCFVFCLSSGFWFFLWNKDETNNVSSLFLTCVVTEGMKEFSRKISCSSRVETVGDLAKFNLKRFFFNIFGRGLSWKVLHKAELKINWIKMSVGPWGIWIAVSW